MAATGHGGGGFAGGLALAIDNQKRPARPARATAEAEENPERPD
jgi:hypothetical protein